MPGIQVPLEYATMNDDDKVGYWYAHLYRAMRWAGEDGIEETTILDRREHAALLAADPDIDRLMPQILRHLARMWMEPASTFMAKVNSQMGTRYC